MELRQDNNGVRHSCVSDDWDGEQGRAKKAIKSLQNVLCRHGALGNGVSDFYRNLSGRRRFRQRVGTDGVRRSEVIEVVRIVESWFVKIKKQHMVVHV